MKFAPYVRLDFMSASLNGYAEQGTNPMALTFGAMSFNSVTGAIGLRGSYDIPMDWGVLVPNARLEIRHAIDGAYNQSVYYTDMGSSLSSTLNQDATTRNSIGATLGVRARTVSGLTGELEYGTSAATDTIVHSIRAAVRMQFSSP